MVKPLTLCAVLAFSLASCTQQNATNGNLHVIPLPQEVVSDTDASPFKITSSICIVYPQGNEKMERNAHFLASYIKEVTGVEVQLTTTPSKQSINLILDSNIANPEGYELQINSDKVTLKARTEAGIFYGIQTLYKALPITQGKTIAALPAGSVKDFPRFGYRGFMLDVGRHFFSVDYLKEVIDMLALHNINYFHWHLTEDQGWRIEIKKYPKLTEVGSYRKETIVKPGSKEFDSTPVKGFYTQEQAREIVKYAADRYITVIPEVDMPGHMMAALASYPELGCTGGPYEVPTRFGVFDEVLCGGNEKTLQFAKDVINEIMDIFPSPYIHIGGDECPKVRWEKCPKCQAKIRELKLKATPEYSKENQLQAYFMSEVEKEINARGRKVMGWDEILEGNATKSTTVTAWTSVKAGTRSAQLGHQTIVCPISHLYFSNPGYNRLKGVSSVERVYDFEPVSDKLTPEEQKNIMGVQACIWTEWTKDTTKVEWQMMPRIAALSELQWSNPEQKNLDSFLSRLRHQLDLYTLNGFHYKQDIENVVIDVNPSDKPGVSSVLLYTFDNAPAYYTTDGSTPDANTIRYEGPFDISGNATIKAVSIRNSAASETAEETLHYNLATMQPIELHSAPEDTYTFKGANVLIDGLYGEDAAYRSGRYLGFYGKDLEATIDLQKDTEISSVFISTCQVPGDYIFGLKGIEVSISNDGKNFTQVAKADYPELPKGSPNNVTKVERVQFDKVAARYVHIIGKATQVLPKWHKNAGHKAYLFVDEIGIE